MRAIVCLLLIVSSYLVDANATDTSVQPHTRTELDRKGSDDLDNNSNVWTSVIVTVVLVMVIIIGLFACAQCGSPCGDCCMCGGGWMRRCGDSPPNVMQGVKIVCNRDTYKQPETEPLIFAATAPVQPCCGWEGQQSGWERQQIVCGSQQKGWGGQQIVCGGQQTGWRC